MHLPIGVPAYSLPFYAIPDYAITSIAFVGPLFFVAFQVNSSGVYSAEVFGGLTVTEINARQSAEASISSGHGTM